MKKFKNLLEEKSNEDIKIIFEESSSVSDFCRNVRGWGMKEVPSIALKHARKIAIDVGFDIEDYHSGRRDYKSNPDKCKFCGEFLSWEDHKAKKVFCNSSCSASFNNEKRQPMSEGNRKKISSSLKKYHIGKGVEYKDFYCEDCGAFIGKLPLNKNRKFCKDCCTNSKLKLDELFEKWKDGTASLEECSSKGEITNGELKSTLARRIKDFQLEEQNHKCKICGTSDQWFGETLVFILDHVDGDWSNQERNNLRLICSNCNSLLETTKHKEKGTGRLSGRICYKNASEKLR